MTPLRVGLLVNPIAGLGGPGGFKGSDASWRDALAKGYAPTAPERAKRFVAAVQAQADVAWTTLPGALGVEGLSVLPFVGGRTVGSTSADDTRRGAIALREADVDLACFVGGDGTATDVAKAIGTTLPCLGVPAGVKVTSAVFAHDVDEAAWLVANLGPAFETVLRDVTDLDEASYREGRVDVRLTGSLRVPLSPAVQGGKVPTGAQTPLEPLVEMVLRDWDPDALHLVGAGSVCLAIKKRFPGRATLLGVDAIQGDRIVASDVDDRTAAQLVAKARAAGRRAVFVASPIGGQGMLLGRGTQVLPPRLLHEIGWDNIRAVAPPEKLLGLRGLHVDSGDPAFDAAAPKHLRVVTGWNETRMMRLLHGAP